MNRAERRRQKKLSANAVVNARAVDALSAEPGQQSQFIRKAIEMAVQNHSAGLLPEAERVYRQILNTDPHHPVALHLYGVLSHQMGKSDVAFDMIEKALVIAPEYEEAHYNLGVVFKDLGKLENVVACCQKAVFIKPDYATAYNNLGVALKELGRSDEAVASYRQALAIAPKTAEVHNNLGAALQDLGKMEEAVASYEQALVLLPGYVDAHLNIGEAYNKLSQLDEAAASYLKALVIQPDHAGAHYNLGNVLKKSGKLDEAIASYRQAVAVAPDYADAHNNLGVSLKEQGRADDAVASYENALVIAPESAETHNNLGAVFQDLGKLDDALAISPDYAEAHYNLGAAFSDLGMTDEAVAGYENAIALKSDFVDAHYNLGVALGDLGQHREAISHLRRSFIGHSGIQPTGDTELSPATTSFFLELTNKCNFHCDFCPSDSQKRNLGFMDLEFAKKSIAEVADKKLARRIALHLMGEPTLHPKMVEILQFGASKNIPIDLVTNGSTLVPKVVPRILDNLYGTIEASHMTPTEETYHIRGDVGLSWSRYIGNIRLLVSEYVKRLANGDRIRNTIDIRVMVTKDTASNMDIIGSSDMARDILVEWRDFAAETERELGLTPFARGDLDGVEISLAADQLPMTYRLQQGIVLTLWRAFTFANTRVGDDFALEDVQETVYCPNPFKQFAILWNGDVSLCCLDYDGQLKVGNIHEESIESVMHGEAAMKVRAAMLGQQPLPSVCRTCQARPVKKTYGHL